MEKKRILIVDDEEGFTRMVRLNLEKTGRYIVKEENHAVNGVATAREFKPDLILMDVRMPAVDGGAVAFKILADEHMRDIPIIFLTAMVAKEETVSGSLRSGGFQFLAKPVNLERLIECIEKNLEQHPPSSPKT